MTPWTIACQAPLSMELSRQEYWSGLPFPSPGDVPNPGIKPGSPALQADSLPYIHRHTHTHTHTYMLFWILFHYESGSCSVVSDFLQPHGLYRPWNSPGQNTGMGSRSLLPGIFPTQGLNPGLPHCRQILYQLSHISVIGYYKILNIVLYAVQ